LTSFVAHLDVLVIFVFSLLLDEIELDDVEGVLLGQAALAICLRKVAFLPAPAGR